jgi:hypothetical protein
MDLTALEQRLQDAVHGVFAPLRSFFDVFGLSPQDPQLYALLVALFWLGLTLPSFYDDYILSRRRLRTRGRVVGIDRRGDEPNAIIEFRDGKGMVQRFESALGTTRQTEQVGAMVAVHYDPLRPKRAREADRPMAHFARNVFLFLPTIGLVVFALWPGLQFA